jgi:DNA replication protein DnaC
MAVPTTTATPDLAQALRGLGLHLIAGQLDDFVAQATRRRASPRQLLEELARLEAQERARKSVERRLARAHLGRFKPIADFDWNWPKEIDRAAIERALQLGFLERGENLVLVATQGLGKTMIAKNLAHAAVLAGATAIFTTAADLLLDLAKQETARALDRRLRHYAQPTLLAIDELGYLAYDNHAADLLFQIVSRRYERRSIVLTTNLVFADWNTVFPNAACATALIDRLTHHAEVLVIKGESYRRREAELAQKARRRGERARG